MTKTLRSGLPTGAYFHLPAVLLIALVLGLNIAHADGRVEAYIRFAHLAPGAPPINIQIEDAFAVLTTLAYPQISEWYSVEPERLRLTIESVDTTLVLHDVIDVDDGQWYTVAVVTSGPDNSAHIHVAEDTVNHIRPGETRVGVLNTLDNGAAIDLYANDAALLQYITYPHFDSVTPSIDVIANVYELELRDHMDSSLVVGEPLIKPLSSGAYYLLVLTGTTDHPVIIFKGPTGPSTSIVQPLPDDDEATLATAHLRLAHFASGLAAVNLHINGERSAVSALAFPEVSDFVTLPPGEPLIAAVDAMGANLVARTLHLQAGSWYTVALIGSDVNGTLQLQPFAEDFSLLGDDQTRIGVFQAIPGIAPLNVLDADNMTLIQLLGYPGSQGDNDGYETVDLPEMTTQIRIVSAADPAEVLVTLPELAYIANRHYLIATLRADPPYTIVTHEIVEENEP